MKSIRIHKTTIQEFGDLGIGDMFTEPNDDTLYMVIDDVILWARCDHTEAQACLNTIRIEDGRLMRFEQYDKVVGLRSIEIDAEQ